MKILQFKFSVQLVLFLLLAAWAESAEGQPSHSPEFSLKACIERAMQNSYQLESDSLLTASLQMVVKQEQSAYRPQISGSAGISGLFLSPYTFGQHYLQAVADWDLGRFWHKTAAIPQKQVEQQQMITEGNKLEIIGVITGLYLDVLQYQLEQQILQSQIDYLSKHIETLTVLWKAGTIRQLEILQARSPLNSLKEELMQKELQTRQTKYALARLMGLDSADRFNVATVAEELPAPDIAGEVEDSWLLKHPQVAKIRKEYEKELLMKKDVEAAYLPHIQAYSGYTLDGDPTGDGNYVLLGLGVTIPVFSWGKKEYQLHEIDFSAEAIQSRMQKEKRNLSIRFGQMAQQIRQTKKMLDFQQEKIKTERQSAEIAELNYKSGLATHLELMTARQKLTEAELKLNSVRNRYLKSVVAFWLLTGQTDSIETIN